MRWINTKKNQLYIILALSLLLNINTVVNKYALDDEMVIKKNMLLHKGFAGIGDLLKQDAYKSYFNYLGYENPNLAGGRYRPLSIVSFAIEQQLFGKTYGADFIEGKEKLKELENFGKDPKLIQDQQKALNAIEENIEKETIKLAPIRHLIQALLFACCCMALFQFLQLYFSSKYPLLPFFATLLFACHPVHTEVIANIKSRDEIFSLWFILLSCTAFSKYFASKKTTQLLLAFLFYLLAFLSKEYAFALIVLVPLCYYLNNKVSVISIFSKGWFIGMVLCTLLWIFIRQAIIVSPENLTDELLNNPYLLATNTQRIASKIAIWLQYLRILCFPSKLSSDYSYNTFPYVEFDSIKVWASLIIWVSIAVITAVLIKRRHVLSLAFAWLIVFFIIINNLFFDIGATMGERLIFHSSVGFCIILAWALFALANKLSPLLQKQKVIAFVLLIAMLIPMSLKTISRNLDWKDDYVLFTTDVNTVPNSALVNCNAGSYYYNLGRALVHHKVVLTPQDSIVMLPYAKKSMYYQTKAIAIHPKYVNAYLNRAITYLFFNSLDSAINDWKMAATLYGGRNPQLIKHGQYLLDKGLTLGFQKEYAKAIRMIEAASMIDPYNAVIWYNLGGAYFSTGKMKEAAHAFEKALQINPNLVDAQNGFNATKQYK